MLFDQITHNGRTLYNVSVDDLVAAGMPVETVTAALDARITNDAHAQIDTLCDRLYTTSPSRDARYNNKYLDAVRYRDAGYPATVSADDYPTLVAEAPARGLTKRQLADVVIAKRDAFNALGGAAEAARAQIEGAVMAAEGEDAKRAAAAAIVATFTALVAAAD